ncbi:nucleotide sugar dehydrogenase [Euzebya tangerina]|uniref:nucleotide sugar dehydrogenase n=1 Tax=Euzebya tangerina TaxID=591198 RepID=UPI000E31DB04|nr:nucleotide sugar dehydrogenase [Euzebya tangerina]
MNVEEIKGRLADRSATVAVIGQGYVGLSVALAAAKAGLRVIGIDTNRSLIEGLADGRLVVAGVREDAFAEGIATGRMTFTTQPDGIGAADIVLLCVPTPVRDHNPDLSAVEEAGLTVGEYLSPGALVILESTTYPGTTEQVLCPQIEKGGLAAGVDFLLAYSAERIDPGNTAFTFADIPRVVGGIDPASSAVAQAFYALLVDVVHPVSSCRAAEMAKLLENTYRMVNIALVNELAMVCSDQGISPWEVIDAAATKPFGFERFLPGPGVGGHCIPIDPTYLTWQSRRDTGRPYRLVELANDINAEMPGYVVSRVAEILNEESRAVKGSKILALGVTYKPDVGDLRESAAVQVIRRLVRQDAQVTFHDPFIDEVEVDGVILHGSELTDELIADADLVAVLTPHSAFDLDHVVEVAGTVFDARNAIGAAPGVVVL